MTISKNLALKIQRALRETVEPELKLDGALGGKSLAALQKLSAFLGLDAPQAFEGEAFDLVLKFIDKRYVSEDMFSECAKLLDVEEAAVRAVAEVETLQDGFLPDGRLTILFERHWFYKKLSEALKQAPMRDHVCQVLGVSVPTDSSASKTILELCAQRFPNVCSSVRGGYKGKEKEWDRFDVAGAMYYEGAALSCSFGTFQIMGFNFQSCGYSSAVEMMVDFAKSEDRQFHGFCMFIKNNPNLLRALRAKNWAVFAEGYNGSAYKENKYDTKMATAYAKWLKYLAA